MSMRTGMVLSDAVALCEEGVDRNRSALNGINSQIVALCEEGVDRNVPGADIGYSRNASPSAKRAWIEIGTNKSWDPPKPVALCEEGVDRNCLGGAFPAGVPGSPSAKRAWIEIVLPRCFSQRSRSPSAKRAWIEICFRGVLYHCTRVALCEEGVDRNNGTTAAGDKITFVALCEEGVDRNLVPPVQLQPDQRSPSAKRAWIEIICRPGRSAL